MHLFTPGKAGAKENKRRGWGGRDRGKEAVQGIKQKREEGRQQRGNIISFLYETDTTTGDAPKNRLVTRLYPNRKIFFSRTVKAALKRIMQTRVLFRVVH